MKKLLIIPFLYFFITGCSPKIQRTVNVTKNIESLHDRNRCFGCGISGTSKREKLNKKSLTEECLKFSIRQKDFDNALERGAKVITSTNWKEVVNFDTYFYQRKRVTQFRGDKVVGRSSTLDWDGPLVKSGKRDGVCHGLSYIVEGKKSVLDKYAPKK